MAPRKSESAHAAMSGMFAGLLHNPDLPVEIQTRIADYAARVSDDVLAEKLLNFANLDPTVEARYAGSERVRVLSAWAKRPGRTQEELIDLAERATRGVAVQKVLGSITGLPEEVYRVLAGKAASMAVAEALLTNPDVPDDVKVTSLRTVGSKQTKSSWRQSHKLSAAVLDQPHLGLHTLRAHSGEVALGFHTWMLETFQLERDDIALCVPVVCSALENYAVEREKHVNKQGSVDWSFSRSFLDAVTSLLLQPAADDVTGLWERVSTAYRSAEALLRTDNQHTAAEVSTALRTRNASALQTRYARGKTLVQAEDPRVAQMADARTSDEVAAAAKVAGQDSRLRAALACNLAVPVDLLAKLVEQVGWQHATRIAHSRRNDPAAYATVAAYTPADHLVRDDNLATTPDPHATLAAVARAYREAGRAAPGNLANSRYLTPHVITELPLSFLSTHSTPMTAQVMTEMLTAACTDDTTWEMFQSLGTGFDGPVSNLLLAVGYIAAPEPQPEPPAAPAATSGELGYATLF